MKIFWEEMLNERLGALDVALLLTNQMIFLNNYQKRSTKPMIYSLTPNFRETLIESFPYKLNQNTTSNTSLLPLHILPNLLKTSPKYLRS